MKKVVRFIIKFVNKATADSVPAYAAQVAFFVMLSFFPFMMLLVMIVSKLSVMNTNVLGYILRVVPSGLESYVAYIVDDVVNANVQSFTLITVFVSLWSAAKGIQALSTGLNKIYGVEQNKNYFLVRLIVPQELGLPSAPKQFIRYMEEDNRPQVTLDVDYENGMGISVGRIREDSVYDWKFVGLSHNTVRGAAGGAVLCAELLKAQGYITKK